MATLSHMQLRLNALDARVTTELFRDSGRHRLIVFVDGVRKGYLTRVPDSGRFAFWMSGWSWTPEYTPIQFELMIKHYMHNNPL